MAVHHRDHEVENDEKKKKRKDRDRKKKRKRKKEEENVFVSKGKNERRSFGQEGHRVGGYVPGKAGVVCPRGVKGVCCIANWWSLLNC